MNTRTHLSLVPPAGRGTTTPGTSSPSAPGGHHRRTGRAAGGHAAAVTALAAGLTLGLAAGALATLATHPGDAAAVLLPVAGAAGITIATAFRSRSVAQRRRRIARVRRDRVESHARALRPRPFLVHSRDEFRPVLVPTGPVAAPARRAA